MAAKDKKSLVRVAVTQAEPVWLDLKETVEKTCKLIAEAAGGGAQLVTFPECWIPGYPAWIWSRPIDFDMSTLYAKSNKFRAQLLIQDNVQPEVTQANVTGKNSLKVDSDEMKQICAAAAKNKIAVCIGFSENLNNSLYISQATIGPDGQILIMRRKLKPTHMERTVFGDGTGGGTLANVAAIPGVGRVSALACWEHIQPLLKYNTCLQRPDIHVAAWPPVREHPGGPALWSMSREGCRNLSQTFAIESGTFVLHTTAVISDKGLEKMGIPKGLGVFGLPGGGSSGIYGPDGRPMSTDIPETEEGILYGDLDFDDILRSKSFVDICGHYSRPDMLWLGVDQKEKLCLRAQKEKPDEGWERV